MLRSKRRQETQLFLNFLKFPTSSRLMLRSKRRQETQLFLKLGVWNPEVNVRMENSENHLNLIFREQAIQLFFTWRDSYWFLCNTHRWIRKKRKYSHHYQRYSTVFCHEMRSIEWHCYWQTFTEIGHTITLRNDAQSATFWSAIHDRREWNISQKWTSEWFWIQFS